MKLTDLDSRMYSVDTLLCNKILDFSRIYLRCLFNDADSTDTMNESFAVVGYNRIVNSGTKLFQLICFIYTTLF
jgi:hypothetical protein